MMLDANSPEFQRRYPHYCHVYDARGHRIRMVVACNTETGEVIRCESDGKAVALNVSGGPWKRHGFWPAPLRVVPLGGPVPAGVPYRVGDGAREQRVDITAAEIIARARAKEQRVDFAEAPRPAEHEAFKGATERVNKLMAGLALPDEPPEQRAAIDAIEESIRPMLKRGEWLDAWRGIDR